MTWWLIFIHFVYILYINLNTVNRRINKQIHVYIKRWKHMRIYGIADFEMEEYRGIGRTRAYRRYKNLTKALRKKKLSDKWLLRETWSRSYYPNLNQYSKNKIHCSCPLCRAKTNNKGRTGSWAPNYNPKISDIRKNEAMDFSYDEYLKM